MDRLNLAQLGIGAGRAWGDAQQGVTLLGELIGHTVRAGCDTQQGVEVLLELLCRLIGQAVGTQGGPDQRVQLLLELVLVSGAIGAGDGAKQSVS